jgi:hypothetical protein
MSGFFRPKAFASALVFLAAFVAAPAMAAESAVAPLAQTASVAGFQIALKPATTAPAAPATYANVAAAIRLAPPIAQPFPVTGPANPGTNPGSALVQPLSLHDLVISFVDYGKQDAEELCLAKAVYFEARGEGLEGQLAVADVVLNRAASGLYPATICGVVTQPAQFSFVRAGRFPRVDAGGECWHKALAIADIARKHLAQEIGHNVLWYHADYVAPVWGRFHTRVAQIGQHIFYS